MDNGKYELIFRLKIHGNVCFLLPGKTADEFYMDSGIKMNIEQAIWQELKETDMNVLYFLIMIRSYIVMTMNLLNY